MASYDIYRMRCEISGYQVLIGNRLWMNDNEFSLSPKVETFASSLEEQGKTCMLVALEKGT